MYPTEETAERNRWQDEYDAGTRDHAMDLWDLETDDFEDEPLAMVDIFADDAEFNAEDWGEDR